MSWRLTQTIWSGVTKYSVREKAACTEVLRNYIEVPVFLEYKEFINTVEVLFSLQSEKTRGSRKLIVVPQD